MSLPRYKNYKNSGVDWLGEVPERWVVASLKRGFDVRLGKMLQSDSSSSEDALLPYLRAANIQWSGIDVADIKKMWFSPNERRQLALLPGDLLISEGGDVGRSTVWRGEIANCYFQNSVNRVRAREGHFNQYLYYWIVAIKDKGYIDVICNKSTIAHFTAEKVQAVPVPFPSGIEQSTIAAFLDRETAKIDALIAEQQRLIALLKEKRQAVISHAVTKGLNSDAAMKDSGIEWLGEVPEHWEITRLRRVISSPLVNGIFKKKEEFGEGTLLVNVSDIYQNDFQIKFSDLDRVRCDTNEMNSYQVLPGDLFFVRSSLKQEGIAVVAVASDYMEPAVFECHLIRARPNRRLLNARYGSYLFNSAMYRFEMIAKSKTTTMTTIDQEAILSVLIPTPPINEQKAIATFLDCEIAKTDVLTEESQRGITLLQERRTALISAAVTGKIDVRGLVAARPEREVVA